MRTVTSIKDPGFSALSKMAKQGTNNADSIVLDNMPLLESAVNAGVEILGVMWDERYVDKDYAISITNLLESRGVDVMCGTHHLIRRLEISQAQPQVVFAIKAKEMVIDSNTDLRSLGSRFLVMLDVMDPMNVGTIMRHAEAFGYRVILAGEAVSGISRHVFRSSTGSAIRKPIYRFRGDGAMLADFISAQDFQMITTSAHADSPISRFEFKKNHVIFVGNESRGLPIELRKACKDDVYIPMMPGGVHSINVAAASSISMYSGMLACGEGNL